MPFRAVPTVDAFLQEAAAFTGVFCFSDYGVLELYGKASSLGLTIPGDISVVEYDNMGFLRFLTPRPTTIHQFKKELGQTAAQLLMWILQGEKLAGHHDRFLPKMIWGDRVRYR